MRPIKTAANVRLGSSTGNPFSTLFPSKSDSSTT